MNPYLLFSPHERAFSRNWLHIPHRASPACARMGCSHQPGHSHRTRWMIVGQTTPGRWLKTFHPRSHPHARSDTFLTF